MKITEKKKKKKKKKPNKISLIVKMAKDTNINFQRKIVH